MKKKGRVPPFLNRDLANVVGDAQQSPFYFSFFDAFEQKAGKAFVVFNISKNRFYICRSSLAVIYSFFGL